MNGYLAYYKGKQAEVYANTTYEAQQKAAKLFKTKRGEDISIYLAEKGGEAVVHSTSEI